MISEERLRELTRELKIIATGILIWCGVISLMILAYLADRII